MPKSSRSSPWWRSMWPANLIGKSTQVEIDFPKVGLLKPLAKAA